MGCSRRSAPEPPRGDADSCQHASERDPYAAKLMSLSELKDSSWAKTVFQISPVGDTTPSKPLITGRLGGPPLARCGCIASCFERRLREGARKPLWMKNSGEDWGSFGPWLVGRAVLNRAGLAVTPHSRLEHRTPTAWCQREAQGSPTVWAVNSSTQATESRFPRTIRTPAPWGRAG